jgi:transcriptional regulator with XRE-family HTH domain
VLDNKYLVGYTQIVQSSKHRTKKGGAVMAYRIRELREKKKLTQEQLAQMSGVSRTTIVLLENNEEHEAMVGTLKSLAAALNVPVSKLFTQKV